MAYLTQTNLTNWITDCHCHREIISLSLSC